MTPADAVQNIQNCFNANLVSVFPPPCLSFSHLYLSISPYKFFQLCQATTGNFPYEFLIYHTVKNSHILSLQTQFCESACSQAGARCVYLITIFTSPYDALGCSYTNWCLVREQNYFSSLDQVNSVNSAFNTSNIFWKQNYSQVINRGTSKASQMY